MTAVSDIMSTDVLSVDPNQTLRDALELFRSSDVSGAPVVDGDRVLGVVSVTDLSEFAATTSAVPTTRDEREASDPLLGPPETWDAGQEEPSAYFVQYWSDVGAEITSRFESSGSPEWDLLADHVVSEVMTRQVIRVEPEASLQDAARLMMDAGVQRLLVMEGEALRGIVTATDMVRALADGRA